MNDRAMIEAVLFVAESPVTTVELAELLERLEGVHYREQQMAVQYDRLKTRESELVKRETFVREFMERLDKAKAKAQRVHVEENE